MAPTDQATGWALAGGGGGGEGAAAVPDLTQLLTNLNEHPAAAPFAQQPPPPHPQQHQGAAGADPEARCALHAQMADRLVELQHAYICPWACDWENR